MSTTTVEVREFADRWKELMAAASAGDDIIVTEHDVPKARVIALRALHAGLIADDFDAPLPDEFSTGSP